MIFGVMTILAGGSVLFSEASRHAAGHYVPFVVWSNFIVGFAYIAAGTGIWKSARWAGPAAAAIAIATLPILAAFGVTVLMEGDYEIRTFIAMTFSLSFWAGVAYALCPCRKGCGSMSAA